MPQFSKNVIMKPEAVAWAIPMTAAADAERRNRDHLHAMGQPSWVEDQTLCNYIQEQLLCS